MPVAERICHFLNALSPKGIRKETKDAAEYAREGYENAEEALSQYGPHGSIEDKVVLDAGCGLGGKTVYYSEVNPRYTVGADFDVNHVWHAKHFADTRRAEKVGFLAADLSRLPFNNDTFDVILLNDVVEHIPRPILRSAFSELRRILKPDGRICLQFPPWSSYNASHLYHYISIPWCHLFFSRETLVQATERYNPEPRIGRLSYTEHFEQLNRIELEEFLTIVDECGLRLLHMDRRMVKKLDLLEHLPLLRKYLTTRIIAVLTLDNR